MLRSGTVGVWPSINTRLCRRFEIMAELSIITVQPSKSLPSSTTSILLFWDYMHCLKVSYYESKHLTWAGKGNAFNAFSDELTTMTRWELRSPVRKRDNLLNRHLCAFWVLCKCVHAGVVTGGHLSMKTKKHLASPLTECGGSTLPGYRALSSGCQVAKGLLDAVLKGLKGTYLLYQLGHNLPKPT